MTVAYSTETARCMLKAMKQSVSKNIQNSKHAGQMKSQACALCMVQGSSEEWGKLLGKLFLGQKQCCYHIGTGIQNQWGQQQGAQTCDVMEHRRQAPQEATDIRQIPDQPMACDSQYGC